MDSTKVTLYKALRTVKDKLDKGQLMLIDERSRPMLSEQMFFVTRICNALLLVAGDPELAETKAKLDQQTSPRARV